MDKHSFPNGKILVRDTLKPDDNLHYEKFSDGTVKCIEDEIPFDVPDNWEWCRLQTICTKEIKRGKAPKYEERSNVIVFAQKCNTKSGFIDISKAKFLAQNTLKKYADEDFLYYNDIIINSTGTGTLGRVGIYKKEDDIYSIKIVPDSHITTVRTIPSEINAQYIYYFLKFNQLYFENSGVGSTNQKELKPEVISTFLIAIPPLNEQNAIINKVNMVNKHLSNLDNEKEQLTELISSTKSKILDLAIRGKLVAQDPNDEPASVLLERIQAEKEELIKQGKIKRDKKESVIFKGDDNSYYQDLPENWEICSIMAIAEVDLGKTLDKNKNTGKFYPYLRSVNIKWNEIDLSDIKEMQFEKDELQRYSIIKGDLLICEGGDVGRCCIWSSNETIYYQNALHRVRFHGGCEPKYFLYFMMYLEHTGYLKRISNGVTIKHLTKTVLSTIPFMLPPLAEQKRIVGEIEKIFATLDDIANEVA